MESVSQNSYSELYLSSQFYPKIVNAIDLTNDCDVVNAKLSDQKSISCPKSEPCETSKIKLLEEQIEISSD